MSFHLDARDVAHALGGEVWARDQVLAPAPGHSLKDRSLSIKLDPNLPDGFVVYDHIHGDSAWKENKAYVHERLGIEPSTPRLKASIRPRITSRPVRPDAEQQRKLGVAQYLLERSEPAKGTIVETYLRARGIDIDRLVGGKLPATVRYLPPSPPKHVYGAMLVPFGVPEIDENGELVVKPAAVSSLHMTKLKHDGSGKADCSPNKIMLGSPVGPLVLGPPGDRFTIVSGEGIENTLSAMVVLGESEGWAAGSAVLMPKLADFIPSCIQCATLIVDDNDAGRGHSTALAKRLDARGIEVTLYTAARQEG